MAYADYEFYTGVYGGSKIPEDAFLRLSNVASAYIDVQTMGRAKYATGDEMMAVQMATCNISEVFMDSDTMNTTTFSGEAQVASETVGAWSKSYVNKGASATEMEMLETRKREALSLWLGNTGLLSAKAYYVRGNCL